MAILTPEAIDTLPPEDRIRPYEEIGKIVYDLGKLGAPVVLTQGVFDVPHVGHVNYIREAQNAFPGAVIVTGVESDESVSRNKGTARPVNGAEERLDMLSEWRSVGLVFVFDDVPNYDEIGDFVDRYRYVQPTAIAVATWDPYIGLKREQARQANTQILAIDYKHENSTTAMLREIGYEE